MIKESQLILVVVVSSTLTCITYTRNFVWHDEIQLWKDIQNKGTRTARVYNGLGQAYWDQQRAEEAIAEFKNATKVAPKDAHAYFNLGVIYEKIGNLDEAAAESQFVLH